MSEVPMAEMVTVTIDGAQATVPKGTLAIRAAEAAGVHVPRFCDHPLLDPVGACRQCLVEITDAGNGRGFPTPQPACTTQVADGMVLGTQVTSASAKKAQADIMELILLNHPLDCPVCDKGGECPLQNQAMVSGRAEQRFDGEKNTFAKPVALSELIVLDRERCVLCTRCTRFSDQISGDPMIQLTERGSHQQVSIAPDKPYDSYFSGNVVQLCPVGALTSADYRFSGRPFDLTTTRTTCENCACGCSLNVDARSGKVVRRKAAHEAEVNEAWACDKGRYGFRSSCSGQRITAPMVRQGDKKTGTLVEVSWGEAIEAAANALRESGASTGFLISGRATLESSYGFSKFARTVVGTNSVDFRSRPSADEETQFLASCVAGETNPVTYAELESAKKVILVGCEPESESPIVFLRLRKAVRKYGLKVETLSAIYSWGSHKLGAQFVPVKPCDLPTAIGNLKLAKGTVVLAGETLAQIPGALSALVEKVTSSPARLAWIPRRAGEIGALKAGCLPGLLPGGYPTTDSQGLSDYWKSDLSAISSRATNPSTMVVSGVEVEDFISSSTMIKNLTEAFVICFDTHLSTVAKSADVVFPVAPLEETDGTFFNWEHRERSLSQVVTPTTTSLTDIRILSELADVLGKPLGFRTSAGAKESWEGIPAYGGPTPAAPQVKPLKASKLAKNQAIVSTWRELLDDSHCLDGADQLKATARPILARVSPATAKAAGLIEGAPVRVSGAHGALSFAWELEPTMVESVIWLPTNAPGLALSSIGAHLGSVVSLDNELVEKGGKK